MESEKMSIRDWVSGFYFVRAIHGLKQATYYSERMFTIVVLFQLAVFGGILFFQIKIYPEVNLLLLMMFYLIISYLLWFFGRNLTKKRFLLLAPSTPELEAMIEKAMAEIEILDAEELSMLQNLVNAKDDYDLFSKKLEEALHFKKLKELAFLKEVAEFIRGDNAK